MIRYIVTLPHPLTANVRVYVSVHDSLKEALAACANLAHDRIHGARADAEEIPPHCYVVTRRCAVCGFGKARSAGETCAVCIEQEAEVAP